MPARLLDPVHPGEVLAEDFLKPMALSHGELAKGLNVPSRRIHEILHSKRAIDAEMALRLGRYFGTTARFWLNLQAGYDLDVEQDRLKDRIESEVRAFPPSH